MKFLTAVKEWYFRHRKALFITLFLIPAALLIPFIAFRALSGTGTYTVNLIPGHLLTVVTFIPLSVSVPFFFSWLIMRDFWYKHIVTGIIALLLASGFIFIYILFLGAGAMLTSVYLPQNKYDCRVSAPDGTEYYVKVTYYENNEDPYVDPGYHYGYYRYCNFLFHESKSLYYEHSDINIYEHEPDYIPFALLRDG